MTTAGHPEPVPPPGPAPVPARVSLATVLREWGRIRRRDRFRVAGGHHASRWAERAERAGLAAIAAIRKPIRASSSAAAARKAG